MYILYMGYPGPSPKEGDITVVRESPGVWIGVDPKNPIPSPETPSPAHSDKQPSQPDPTRRQSSSFRKRS